MFYSLPTERDRGRNEQVAWRRRLMSRIALSGRACVFYIGSSISYFWILMMYDAKKQTKLVGPGGGTVATLRAGYGRSRGGL